MRTTMTTDTARMLRLAPHADAPCTCPRGGSELAVRPDSALVRHADTVVKAHAPGTAASPLAVRLAVAAHPALRGVLLPPLKPRPTSWGGRLVSYWPLGSPVDPLDRDGAPWEEAGRLLARLHTAPLGPLPPLPPMRAPLRVAEAVARMPERAPGAAGVRAAFATLPGWVRDGAPPPAHAPVALCHGDLHLGQLVRHPAPSGPWLLIDVDDLGAGDPAWDLARPAAWFACGLLAPAEWARFTGAYRAAGGPALAGADDPWAVLDVPARALTVQTAARAVARAAARKRPLDEVERAVADACPRMASVRAAAPPGGP